MLQLGVCAKRVFGIFDRVLKRITAPIYLVLSPTFMILGTFCFCECIWMVHHQMGFFSSIFILTMQIIVDVIAPSLSKFSISICLLVLLNLCMHYFYAITISPGFIDRPPPRDYGKITMARGASWSEKGVNITPASLNECRRCKRVRPEVSI